MESIKRLNDVDPSDLAVVERLFGHRVEASANVVLILKTLEPAQPAGELAASSDELPPWYNVMEGMTDEQLAEFDATLAEPVILARPE